MRYFASILVCTAVLSACGPNLTPEQQAQRQTNIAQTNSALSQAKTVEVNSKTFRVAHVVERNQALVDLVGPSGPYFATDIEAAATAATGCSSNFDGGILAFIGGDIRSADLAELRTKVSGRFNGWGVSLSC